jgi:serine/threonine-protein kinase RsbT
MEHEIRVPINSDADIVPARQQGRAMAKELGFSTSDQALIATAISEVARNIVQYAVRGEIILAIVRENGKQGILVVAQDEGPGIADINLALQDGYSTTRSLGLGLPGARRLSDEFHIISEVGRGTTVTMKKWMNPRGK